MNETYAKYPPQELFLLVSDGSGETSFTYPMEYRGKSELEDGVYLYGYNYSCPDDTVLDVEYWVNFNNNTAVRNDGKQFTIISIRA